VNEELAEVGNKHSDHDENLKKVSTAIRIFVNPANKLKYKINFIQKEKKND
jgi:hypothetical protein